MEQDTKIKILVVEDDASLKESLVRLLQNRNFLVQAVENKQQAVEQIKSGQHYDIYLLDVWLPDGNGFDICREIRKISQAIVMFLTSCDDEESITKGLDIGGDDYITKPFRAAELISRIHANLRRLTAQAIPEVSKVSKVSKISAADLSTLPQGYNRRKILASGDIRADFERAEIFKDGQLLKLTPLEAQLLEIFLRNPEIIIKRGQFLEKLWDGHGNFVEDNTLTVSVSRLKNKLGMYTEGKQQYIETIRGYGYRWNLRCVISEEESSRESGR